MSRLAENVEMIRRQILQSLALSEYDEDPQMIVVTKTQSFEDISKLYELGLRHFAENRPEKLLERQAAFPQPDIVWHLIGTLQTRKVRDVINQVDYFHALDRLKLVDQIEQRADKIVKCFLQVNIFEEDSKHGFAVDQVDAALAYIAEKNKIQVVGLMTMAPFEADQQLIRAGFKQLKEMQLAIKAKGYPHAPCHLVSMGMSQDFPIAVSQGATHLRIGSAFFKK